MENRASCRHKGSIVLLAGPVSAASVTQRLAKATRCVRFTATEQTRPAAGLSPPLCGPDLLMTREVGAAFLARDKEVGEAAAVSFCRGSSNALMWRVKGGGDVTPFGEARAAHLQIPAAGNLVSPVLLFRAYVFASKCLLRQLAPETPAAASCDQEGTPAVPALLNLIVRCRRSESRKKGPCC